MYDFIDSEPYEAPTPMLRRVAKCAVAGLLGIILWISIVAFFACAYWLFMGMTAAHAHSWYTGEKDPVSGYLCCDGDDCMEIADTDVMQVAGGFIYLPLDNKAGPVKDNPGFITAARVKSSASFGYAICLGGGQYSTGSTSTTAPMFIRCFFAPSGF